ncbi:MAG TPA: ectonucleotide pyrophosphatase/phosphodiesterase [Pyrinomonadaceae bacterium]|jgi:predicted AlkP superfamily pyrophosphatase or phosphodiesterase
MNSLPLFSICFKRRAVVLVAFLVLAALAVSFVLSEGTKSQKRSVPGKAKRVIVISLDGLDARYLNRRDEYGLKIPNLRRLMSEGVAARGVISVFPSVTYPAHTTIVTGAYPARHGIYGNEVLEAPAGTARREWNWFARDIRAETLWDAARKRGLKVGMVSWPVGTGAGDYNVPEILKFGGTLLDTLARIKENSTPKGFVGEIEQRDPTLYAQANKDEQDDMRTSFADYVIAEKRPDLMFVHLFDLDHFEHAYGPFTPEAFAMLEKSDAYLGRILEAARRSGTLDETAVFIVSDHGFMPISKEVNPGVLLERAGLLKVREEKNAKGETVRVVTEWRAMPFVTNGSCAIILRDENDREARRKVLEIFRPLAGRDGSGIREVLEDRRLRSLGANPRAALMLDAADGYAFGTSYTGEVITASKDRGAHGYLPTRPDYYASFIAAGAGIKRGAGLGTVRMIDIGPTIARSLGLTLLDADGRAIRLQ